MIVAVSIVLLCTGVGAILAVPAVVLFSGAITGAIFGGIGGAGSLLGNALGKSCALVEKFGTAIKLTSKISTGVSVAMDGFDTLAFGIGMFDSDNVLVNFNQQLHSNGLYNAFQIGVNALATFSGGMANGMSKATPACFVAGTLVMTAMGLVAIECIKAGDYVLSADTDTMQTDYKRVLETYIRKVDILIHLTVNGEEIITTVDHPFYVKGQGFVNAAELCIGNVLVNSDGDEMTVVKIFRESCHDEKTTVYNFQVEDYHTYFVSRNCIFVHNADCTVHSDGEIEITDWEGYPEDGPKPDGKLHLIDGDEYQQARTAANKENAAIHRNNPELKGKDIHEVHPVKYNGSPTDHANKIFLTRAEHAKYTRFWNEIQRQAELQM